MHRRQPALVRSTRGSAVVEFALVLPILLIVALGLVQVGLLARDELIVVQSARAAARVASVDPNDDSVRGAAIDGGPGLDPGRLDVTVERNGARGDPVMVTVGYQAAIEVPFVGWLFPPAVSLTATATMRREYP